MGIPAARRQREEPKVCANDLLKSPLNLTDYFLLRISASGCRSRSGLVSIFFNI
jgi:hypothetical protein